MRLITANIDIDELIKNQDFVDWKDIFNNYFNQEEINKLCANVKNENFWNYVFNKQNKHIDVKYLAEYQYKVNWMSIFAEREFNEAELEYLYNNIVNNDEFMECLLCTEYVTVDYLIERQDEIAWRWNTIFNNREFTEQEIRYLCNNITSQEFVRAVSESEYIFTIDIQYLAKNQNEVSWQDVFYNCEFNNREFTEEEKEYLYNNVKNNEFLKIFNAKYKVSQMSYQELINNRNKIDWNNCDIDDLNISENEKKLLLTRINDLGIKYAEDISDDFSQIKEKPIKRFYILGEKNMHGERTGAFVIVKDNNNPVDVMFEPGGDHYPMLQQMAEKYGYSQDTLAILMNIEAGISEISGKMDLDSEEEKELEYAKEHLHCCCGYVHVDENNENPIAIMDATRVYNFSPQQVAKILKDKKYEGQEIIAFGINDAGASAIAFMKVAKITKKRLISHNYRILYWYNKGC